MADGVDRLDAIRRREVATQERTAGAQYAGSAAGSAVASRKLPASGVRFHETASAKRDDASGSGRQRRSESVRIAIGIAA